jgi:hypothetical protein
MSSNAAPQWLSLSQALRATICSTQRQGRRANSLRSNKRDSVGPLRVPQTLPFPCFEAATEVPTGARRYCPSSLS